MQYAQPAPQQQFRAPQPPDPDLLHTNTAEWQRQNNEYMAYMQNAQLAAVAMPFIYNQASLAKNQAKSDPRWSNIWQKYGAEVEREIATVPVERHTKELFDKACEIVKGRHVDDIALEMATRMHNASSGIERSGSAGGPPPAATDPIEELFRDDNIPYVRMQKSAGITAAQVKEYCAKRKITPAKFVEQVKGNSVIFDANLGTTTHST